MQGPALPPGAVTQDVKLPVLELPPAQPPQHQLPTGGPEYTQAGQRANRHCPVCDRPVKAARNGSWACRACGSKGGTFKGERMYVEVYGTPGAVAAAPGRAARRRQQRSKQRSR